MPSPEKGGDAVLAIAAQLYWMGDTSTKWDFTFDDEDEDVLLSNFEKMIHLDYDVDCFVYVSDNCDPIQYLGTRKPSLGLSKFQRHKSKLLRRKLDGAPYGIIHPGRSKLDIRCALQKMMIEPKLDGFGLKDAIFHPSIVRDKPCARIQKFSYIMAKFVDRSGRRDQVETEVDWVRKIEQNNAMLLGFIEISAASSTQLTVAVSNGQQIRVWKKLISKFHSHDLIVNKGQLLRPPVVVQLPVPDSSFPDPPIVTNTPFVEGGGKTVENTRCRNLVGGISELSRKKKPKKSKKKYQGGYVCDPEAGFYAGESEPTFTFDFSSLYPSIIIGNRVCYMRLVYDAKYLDDDRYIKSYIPVNERECVVMVTGKREENGELVEARTILPETIDEVCKERARVRRLMSTTEDKFELISLNAKQLGCKVFQNAVYGFLGVERNALLACPVLMAVVCRIGQNMIKKVRYMMLKDHGAFVVYGDTDSVMVQFPHPSDLSTQECVFEYYYGLCRKIAAAGTRLFPEPNVLEFESMKFPFWLRKKKNYAALEYPGKNWRVTPTLVIKGLPFKKRDRCPMVRRIGYQVMKHILNNESNMVHGYLKGEFRELSSGRVQYADLAITCQMQSRESYKSDNLIQVETAKKISTRTGSFFEAGSRLSYVVVAGDGPLYYRGEDPLYASEQKMQLDLLYYLDKQLLSAVQPLLQFHTGVDISRLISTARQEINRRSLGVSSLFSMAARKRKYVRR